MTDKTFRNLCVTGGFIFSLFYVPLVFAEQVADLFGYRYTHVMLDGGFGDLLGLMVLIYSVLFLSLGLGYKFSRRAGNVVAFIWGLAFFASMIVLVWQK